MTAEAWAAEGEAWTRWARGPALERYAPFSEAPAEQPFPRPLDRLPLALAIRAGKPG